MGVSKEIIVSKPGDDALSLKYDPDTRAVDAVHEASDGAHVIDNGHFSSLVAL